MKRAIAGTAVLVVSCALMCCGLKTHPRPATVTAPGYVGLVTVHVYPGTVDLRWDLPQGGGKGAGPKEVVGFKVYRSSHEVEEACEDCEDAGGFHAKINIANPMNAEIKDGEVLYKDQRITLCNVYYYAVSAFNKRGIEGPKSPVITVIYDSIPPSPKGLRTSYDSRGIVLRWDAPIRPSGIRAYRIYRGETRDAHKLVPVGRTRWAEKFYIDDNVEKDKPYYYIVRSMQMKGGIPIESGPSAMVQAVYPRTKIEAPTGVKAVSTAQGVRVFWDQAKYENERIMYNVYRSEDDNLPKRINRQSLKNTWIMDSNVRKGHRYRYQVRAFPAGKSHEESRSSASETVTQQY